MAKHVLGLWALFLGSLLPARALRVSPGESKNRTAGVTLEEVEQYVGSGLDYLKNLIDTAERKAHELSTNPNMMRIPGVPYMKKGSGGHSMLEQFLREMKTPGYVPTAADLADATCLPTDFANTSTAKGASWMILCFHLSMGWWSSDPYRQAENRFDIDTFVQCGADKIGIREECFGCLGQLIVKNVVNSCTTCFYDTCGSDCKACSEPGVSAFKTCVGGNWVKFGQGQVCKPRKTTTLAPGATSKPQPGLADLPGPGPWEKQWIADNWLDADSDHQSFTPPTTTTTTIPLNTTNLTRVRSRYYTPRTRK